MVLYYWAGFGGLSRPSPHISYCLHGIIASYDVNSELWITFRSPKSPFRGFLLFFVLKIFVADVQFFVLHSYLILIFGLTFAK